MASILNITDRLNREDKQIQIGTEIFNVNCSFESMVEIEAIDRSEISDSNKMIKTLEILLGEDYEKLKAMHLDVANMKVVFIAIMATVNACTYEEMEARFQKLEG